MTHPEPATKMVRMTPTQMRLLREAAQRRGLTTIRQSVDALLHAEHCRVVAMARRHKLAYLRAALTTTP